jgi:hypothetical protein
MTSLKATPIWDDPGRGGVAPTSRVIGKSNSHHGGTETLRTAKDRTQAQVPLDYDNFHQTGRTPAEIKLLRSRSAEITSVAPAAYSVGRKIDNAVPWPHWPVLLFIRMLPRCFSRMPRVIHNPRPVPTSVLVVKNGWKIFFLCLGSIPLPVSRMVMRTP